MNPKIWGLFIVIIALSLYFLTKQEDTSKSPVKEKAQLSQGVSPKVSLKETPQQEKPVQVEETPKPSPTDSDQSLVKEMPQQEKPTQVGTEANVEPSISDVIIAKTAKMLIRQIINHVDIEKKKEAVIEKIKRKSDRKCTKEMNRIFDDLDYMNATDTLGITRNSSREEVITLIKYIDKNTLLEKLDEFPDHAIAKLIKKKLQEQEVKSIAEVKDFLNSKIDKLLM